MIVVSHAGKRTEQFIQQFEVFDSLVEAKKFIQEKWDELSLLEFWVLSANFGVDDMTKEVGQQIYLAKVGIKTVVENTDFSDFIGEPMEFVILSAVKFSE